MPGLVKHLYARIVESTYKSTLATRIRNQLCIRKNDIWKFIWNTNVEGTRRSEHIRGGLMGSTDKSMVEPSRNRRTINLILETAIVFCVATIKVIKRRRKRQSKTSEKSENWKIKSEKLERRRSRQLYRETRPRLNLNQALEEINWNIRTRENSLTRSPVSFSVQTSRETTRENSPEQSNDEESGSELSEREFQERVREFEQYRTRTIEEARRSRRSRRNSNNNQPLEIVEEENIEEQEGLREYLQEFEIEIEQEENNKEPIVENNIMDILALRSKKFRGDGTQDPVEWLKNYEKTARMNGWTDDQRKERIYTVLDDAADEWYNEVYTQTYGIGNDEWPTWIRLKELFLEQFCNRRWMNKWTKELEKLKQQPGESVDQYAARFKKIIRKGAPAMQNAEKLYHFKKGLRKGMLPIISMHNPEDIATVIELAQHYEEAEDLEEGLEPEESEDEIKVKPKTKRKIKKKKYESESSDEEIPVKKEKVKKKEVEVDPIEELTKKMNELTIKLAKTERPQTLQKRL
ncbi:hypothetical protein Glove_36g5 [Diversispora epigaea]|uniref:Retrotransposon gag domain-containing protein n=1 Tax=Diversispora epigaea TaxID=1348612 RepID=A0A397JIJ5_9GLOM|nr:hypothetical protein Glove_36g5 [Diversispora epigaea]